VELIATFTASSGRGDGRDGTNWQVVLPTAAPAPGRSAQAYREGQITARVGRRDFTFRLRVPYTVVN
jgi:hypothetical protein